MKKYRCLMCGYIYDETKEGAKFTDLPDSWTCPMCGVPKSMFEEIEEETAEAELPDIPEKEISSVLSTPMVIYQNIFRNTQDLTMIKRYTCPIYIKWPRRERA